MRGALRLGGVKTGSDSSLGPDLGCWREEGLELTICHFFVLQQKGGGWCSIYIYVCCMGGLMGERKNQYIDFFFIYMYWLLTCVL